MNKMTRKLSIDFLICMINSILFVYRFRYYLPFSSTCKHQRRNETSAAWKPYSQLTCRMSSLFLLCTAILTPLPLKVIPH